MREGPAGKGGSTIGNRQARNHASINYPCPDSHVGQPQNRVGLCPWRPGNAVTLTAEPSDQAHPAT